MTVFNPENWFWTIDGDTSRAWSSATGSYTTAFDPEKTTNIASEAELSDVLRVYGLAVPQPTLDDYKTAIQTLIESVARAKDYDSGVSLAGYKGSPVAVYADDAEAFTNWRDPLWPFVFEKFAEVRAGTIPQPTVAELLGMLPAPPWPAA